MTHALMTDGYKTFHKSGLHNNITGLYGNFTNRHGKYSNLPDDSLGGVVFVGLQYFIIDTLMEGWRKDFFSQDKSVAVHNIKRILDPYLGIDYDASHFEDLWELGYLPIEIKAVPEGTITPYGVAPLTIQSTVDGFPWLPLYIETVMSTELWPMSTSATTAAHYLKNTKKYFAQAGLDQGMTAFMNHDFSMRGCFGKQAAAMSGFAHLAVGNLGTDTLPAILFAEDYYGANQEKELVGCSVKATEHSITTSFIATYAEEHGVSYFEAEVEYARKLLRENPTGILSYVADSFDFWKFVEEGLPLLKNDILAREGTFVVRPDSGDPVDVLCGKNSNVKVLGSWSDAATFEEWKKDVAEEVHEQFCDNLEAEDPHYSETTLYKFAGKFYKVTYEPELNRHDKTYYYVDNYDDTVDYCTFEEVEQTVEDKGLIETLYGIFGGTETLEGYKVLDNHIGAIYGDSITLERQEQIYSKLMAKGFAPNVVLGVGSYSYQYVTRDTHGSAVKATAAFLEDGTVVNVCKDPKTDSSKKSAKGLLRLEEEGGKIVQYDEQSKLDEAQGLLQTVFRNGELLRETTLQEIRETVASQLGA